LGWCPYAIPLLISIPLLRQLADTRDTIQDEKQDRENRRENESVFSLFFIYSFSYSTLTGNFFLKKEAHNVAREIAKRIRSLWYFLGYPREKHKRSDLYPSKNQPLFRSPEYADFFCGRGKEKRETEKRRMRWNQLKQQTEH